MAWLMDDLYKMDLIHFAKVIHTREEVGASGESHFFRVVETVTKFYPPTTQVSRDQRWETVMKRNKEGVHA